jgi:glycerate 2-kinase
VRRARPMARALHSILGDRIEGGCLAGPVEETKAAPFSPLIEIREAAHPYPDSSSVRAAKGVLAAARGLKARDLLLVLISGGASSMLTLPVNGISLVDFRTVTKQLLLSGADIESVNIIRKHLSQLSGGRLAHVAAPSRVVTLILSDVVGDAIDTIGSGPTAPDPSTYQDALERLDRFGLKAGAPKAIVSHLISGALGRISETPKPDDPVFKRVSNILVGGNRTAQLAAVESLVLSGVRAEAVEVPVVGEARSAGEMTALMIRKKAAQYSTSRCACLVFGGETTVTVRGPGKGGRNQEVALAAAVALSGMKDVLIMTMATDGRDGPTDAAGAAATGETFERGLSLLLHAKEYLDKNDSYAYFAKLDDLLITGPSHTNAADLAFVFFPAECRPVSST